MVEKANNDVQALQGTSESISDAATRGTAGFPVNTLMTGVGRAVDHVSPRQVDRPKDNDPTSEQAFEEYKTYNTNTNLRANQRRFWAGLVDKVSANIMFAAAAAIGTTWLATSGAGVALPVFLGAVVVSAVTFFALHQGATREQSDKSMDVSDFHVRREAALIAKEIKSELEKERGPTKEVSKECDTATAIDDNREPTYLIRERSWQNILAAPPEIHSERG